MAAQSNKQIAAAAHTKGARHAGSQAAPRRVGVCGPDRAHDSVGSLCHPAELVAAGAGATALDAERLPSAGRRPGLRADAIRGVANEVAGVASRLLVQSTVGSMVAAHRMPLTYSDGMSIDDRIHVGDMDAVHDCIVEAINSLETLVDRAAAALCDEPDVLRRLAEVRRRQEETGRQWRRPPTQDARETDPAGTEGRGPAHQQERPRRARAGKAVSRRRK